MAKENRRQNMETYYAFFKYIGLEEEFSSAMVSELATYTTLDPDSFLYCFHTLNHYLDRGFNMPDALRYFFAQFSMIQRYSLDTSFVTGASRYDDADGDGYEFNSLHLFRQLLEVFGVGAIRFLEGGVERFSSFWIGRGIQHQHLSVGRDIERCVGIGAQQLQNRFLDNQCQAVSVFDQIFTHDRHPQWVRHYRYNVPPTLIGRQPGGIAWKRGTCEFLAS